MRYQQIKDKIQSLRVLSEQCDLKADIQMLDEAELFLEHKTPIISVIGAKASGKCSLVNSMLASDILPSSIFKPRVLYRVRPDISENCIRTKTGVEILCKDLNVIEKYSKYDYDLNVIVGFRQSEVGYE